ncbi:hypothetical protein HV186_00455 [Citrobacter freundii]|uniref:hypothetical protein n=1 Tax=Citrobacter freundii TaxID=546 RepID=UPI0015EAA0DD|nr:hypothetical protein [Citrobacter freundii]QLY50303.1 hypothetical protein HV186_00455 [Citrobacter freundii]
MKAKGINTNKLHGQSLWYKNGIPALEYCTLPRAAELLGCKVSDILHLSSIGAIHLSVMLNRFEASVLIHGLKNINDRDDELFDELMKRNVIDSTGMLIDADGNLSRVFLEYTENDGRKSLIVDRDAEIRKNLLIASISGLWGFKSHFGWEEDMEKFGVAEINTLGLVFYPADTYFFQSSIRAYLQGEKIPDEITYQSLAEITPSDIYVTKKQLELMHGAIGNELPNFINQGVERSDFPDLMEKPIEVNTNKIGEFLDILIRSVPELGDDVMEATAHKRHGILSAFLEKKQKEGRFLDVKMPASATIEKYFKI